MNLWKRMMGELEPQSDPLRRLEVLLPALAMGWRVLTMPVLGLWRDWVILVSVFWIYTIFQRRSPSWPRWAVTVMAYLLAIYVAGQLPHTLSVWGSRP